LYGFAVERKMLNLIKSFVSINCGKDRNAVISGIGRIIGDVLLVIKKLNEAGIFNASAFVFGNGKDHPLGYAVIGVETDLIIGIRKPAHDLEGSVLDGFGKLWFCAKVSNFF
jgi:hypothetical protein